VRCTIDASVFVASARSDESNYLTSRRFLSEARSEEVYCPTLALAECAAAIARQTGDCHMAGEMVGMIECFPGINLVSLDLPLARRAAQIAVEHRLRGADAAYVALADAYDAALISWDQEMLKRCPAAVETMTPAQWLEAH
jgi:predicted nucleic acid-binding protein